MFKQKTRSNSTPKIWYEKHCECSTSKRKKEKKESNPHKKFTTFFIIVELASFYQFSTRFTTNIIFLFITINLLYQQM